MKNSAICLLRKHPVAGIVVVGIGMPVAVVAAVFIATAMVMLPISCLSGWI